MKKYLKLLTISVLIVLKISAQDTLVNKGLKLKYGIKGGINIANVTETPSPTVETKSLIGINAGFFATIPIDTNFAIQPEFNYSQMGATVSGNAFSGGDLKLILSYFNVPLLAKYYPAKSIALLAGPQIGFLNSAITKSANSLSLSPSNDFSSHVKKLDFSAVFGAELFFSDILYLSGRYQLGLANVSSSTDGVTDKNNGFTITLNLIISN